MIIKLILYEIRKLQSFSFAKWILLLLYVVNIICCVFYTVDNRHVPVEHQSYINEVYSIYEKDPNYFYSEYERIKKDNYGIEFNSPPPENIYGNEYYPDINIFDDVNDIINKNSKYHERLETIIRQAESIKSNYEVSAIGKHSYAYQYQSQIETIYTDLNSKVVLDDKQVIGWNELFSYNSDYFFIFLLVGALTIMVAHLDKKNDFYRISSVCYYGRSAMVVAKYFTCILVSVSFLLLFSVSNYVVIGLVCSYSNHNIAAQSVELLELYPYFFSVGNAFLHSILLKAISVIIFSSVVFTVTIVLRSVIFGIGTGALISLFGIIFSKFQSIILSQWYALNLWNLYNAKGFLVRLRTLNIFDKSIYTNYILLLIVLLTVLVSISLSIILYPKNKAFRRQKNQNAVRPSYDTYNRKYSLTKNKFVSLCGFECMKNRSMYYILIVLIFAKIITTFDYFQYEDTSYERIYKQYLLEISGEYSDDKDYYLECEYDRCSEIVSQYVIMEDRYWSNQITSKMFNAYLRDYNTAKVQIEVLDDLIQKSEYLKQLNDQYGILGSFVYETGYNKLIYQEVDWMFIIWICILSSSIYLLEFEKNISGTSMYMIIQTTPLGRKHLYKKKLLYCILNCGTVYLIFRIVDYAALLSTHQLPDMSASLISIMSYGEMSRSLRVGDHLLITESLSFIGALAVSCMWFCLAVLIRKNILIYSLETFMVVAPYFIAEIGGIKLFDITMWFDVERMCRRFLYENCWVYAFFLMIMLTILLNISLKRVTKGLR